MSETPSRFTDTRAFSVVSWIVTLALAAGLISAALWYRNARAAAPLPASTQPATETGQTAGSVTTTAPAQPAADLSRAIPRSVHLKTRIPADRPRTDVRKYMIVRGDSIFGIAREYGLKPESVLWANWDTLGDGADFLTPGTEIRIPPVDGVLYQWKEGDTVEAVAKKFKASVDDILSFPGNNVDLTDPQFKPGQLVMIPGGQRDYSWVIQTTYATGQSGTANVGGISCNKNFVGGTSFMWPADNRSLSGTPYQEGHLAIDIAAGEGAAVYASESGIVTMAQGGWNYGYGNVIQIDHGGGWVTLYAHLSVIMVSPCQQVYAGQRIGSAGNTGNSFGPHLHFEVRYNRSHVNPFSVIVR